MAKITLDDITSSFASTSLFQTNFTAIEDELNDKVLYRNNPAGEANQMENDLDMNSNDILNASEIDTAQLRLNGSLVTFGSNVIENTFQETEFTNVAGETDFTVDYTPGFVIVLINGVELGEDDFTATNGTTVTLAEAVTDADDIVKVRAFGSFNVADALAVSNNLSDLTDASAARTNLDVYSTTEVNNLNESFAELGTVTFSSDVYTFTPISGEFNTLTTGMVIRFRLPATANTTTTPAVDYDGTEYTMKWIDGSSFDAGDLDDTYNKQILDWYYDGTDFLLASDLSGSNSDGEWTKFVEGLATCVKSGNDMGNMSSLGNVFGTDFLNWTFPISFSSNVSGSATNGPTDASRVWFGSRHANSSAFFIAYSYQDDSGEVGNVTFYASGRWY